MAIDKFGSHVAETAFKSLAMHLQDDQSYLMVEEALYTICQRVPLDALEGYHVTKPSTILTERLSCVPAQPRGNNLRIIQNSFPETFNFLVHEILNHAKDEISSLRVEKYSSFVLQSLLKLLAGDDPTLLHAILIVLGCQEASFLDNRFTDVAKQKLKREVLVLIEDTAASHLLEVNFIWEELGPHICQLLEAGNRVLLLLP